MKVFWIVLLSIAFVVSFLLPPDAVLFTCGIIIGVPLFAIVRLIMSKHVKKFFIVQLCIAWIIGVIILFVDEPEAAEWSYYILDGVSIEAIVALIVDAVKSRNDDSDTQASSNSNESRSNDTPVYREDSSTAANAPGDSWDCPTCGTKNKIDSPRCWNCDTKNPDYTPAKTPTKPHNSSVNVDLSKNEPGSHSTSGAADIVFCSKCGTKMPGDSLFCSKCGSRIPVIEESPEVHQPSNDNSRGDSLSVNINKVYSPEYSNYAPYDLIMIVNAANAGAAVGALQLFSEIEPFDPAWVNADLLKKSLPHLIMGGISHDEAVRLSQELDQICSANYMSRIDTDIIASTPDCLEYLKEFDSIKQKYSYTKPGDCAEIVKLRNSLMSSYFEYDKKMFSEAIDRFGQAASNSKAMDSTMNELKAQMENSRKDMEEELVTLNSRYCDRYFTRSPNLSAESMLFELNVYFKEKCYFLCENPAIKENNEGLVFLDDGRTLTIKWECPYCHKENELTESNCTVCGKEIYYISVKSAREEWIKIHSDVEKNMTKEMSS